VNDGRAQIGSLSVEVNQFKDTKDSPAFAYVRPHDLEILQKKNGNPAFEATVKFISSLGSIVRLELQTEDNAEYINAELTRQKYLSLDIKVGSKVFVEPKNIQIFLNA
jgi:sulfate transport system ATP-binding protein